MRKWLSVVDPVMELKQADKRHSLNSLTFDQPFDRDTDP